MHVVTSSLQSAQLYLWQLKDNTEIQIDIKWLPKIRGTCSKMDKNYPKVSNVEEKPE